MSEIQIDVLRNQIDLIDLKLLKLLNQRFNTVALVWQYKKENAIQALQADRWKHVLEWVKKQGIKYNIPPGCVENIWNEIHRQALDIENKILINK